jgi:hypothetical protein
MTLLQKLESITTVFVEDSTQWSQKPVLELHSEISVRIALSASYIFLYKNHLLSSFSVALFGGLKPTIKAFNIMHKAIYVHSLLLGNHILFNA